MPLFGLESADDAIKRFVGQLINEKTANHIRPDFAIRHCRSIHDLALVPASVTDD